MATCEICGNDYDRTFTVTIAGTEEAHVFDSFECAVHALAPTCEHCGCRVLGHGVQVDAAIFCCAHCAEQSGRGGVADRARRV
jgi:Rieske Fe-S protein